MEDIPQRAVSANKRLISCPAPLSTNRVEYVAGGERGDDDSVEVVEAVQAETAKRVGAHSW